MKKGGYTGTCMLVSHPRITLPHTHTHHSPTPPLNLHATCARLKVDEEGAHRDAHKPRLMHRQLQYQHRHFPTNAGVVAMQFTAKKTDARHPNRNVCVGGTATQHTHDTMHAGDAAGCYQRRSLPASPPTQHPVLMYDACVDNDR